MVICQTTTLIILKINRNYGNVSFLTFSVSDNDSVYKHSTSAARLPDYLS